MKPLFAVVLLLAVFALSGCAPAGMSASLQVRSAPPPPAFQFNDEPRFNYLSDRRVSVIADDSFGYDMFSSGGSYYLYSGGYWYQSPTARGPFTAVEERRVPRQVFDVNDTQYRWRNHPTRWRGGRPNTGNDQHRGGDNGGPGH